MSKTLASFYHGKRVLVTGHTGFKGSWLSALLVSWGAEVSGIALPPPSNPSMFDALGMKEHLQHHVADIRRAELIEQIVSRVRPDVVFHLAAQPLVRLSYDEPALTISTNVIGTTNVLDAVRKQGGVGAVVCITTDKVYENREWVYPYREVDSLGGYDPYSASKSSADIITQCFLRSYFNPTKYRESHETLVAIARAGNVIGGGDWAKDRLIPDLIRALYEGDGIVTLRNPRAIRPWEHVLEPLSGYLLLGKLLFEGRTDVSGAWNFGPNTGSWISVEDIALRIFDIAGRGMLQITPDHAKHEATRLMLDVTKAQVLLGWQSHWQAKRAVEETALWYAAFYGGSTEMLSFTLNQAEQYFREKTREGGVV